MENSAPAPPQIFSCSPSFEGQAALLKQLKPAIRAGSTLIDATVALAAGVGGRASRTLGSGKAPRRSKLLNLFRRSERGGGVPQFVR